MPMKKKKPVKKGGGGAMKKQAPVPMRGGGAAKKKKPVPMRGGGLPKQMKKGGDTMSVAALRKIAKEKGYTLKKDS